MSLYPGRNGGGVEGAREKGEWQCTGRILMTYYHSRSTPGHAMQSSPPRPSPARHTRHLCAPLRCTKSEPPKHLQQFVKLQNIQNPCTGGTMWSYSSRSTFSKAQFSFKARRRRLYFATKTSALRRWSGVDSLLSLNIHPESPRCREKPTPTVSEEVLALGDRGT